MLDEWSFGPVKTESSTRRCRQAMFFDQIIERPAVDG